MATFDYIVVIIYMTLMVGIGLYYHKYMKQINTYYTAEGKIPWTIAALSLFMSSFSALVFVMYAGIGYRLGIVAVTLCWATPPAFFIGAYIFSKRWKRAGIITPVQFLETRYNFSVRQLIPVISIPLALVDNAMKVFALAVFVKNAFSISIELSIITCGLIVGIYTFMGGLWAVTVTDVIQFLVLASAVLAVLPLSMNEVGGITEFFRKTSDLHMLNPLGGKDISYLVVFLFLIMLSYNYRWSLVQRYYCVKDERSARRVGVVAGILFIIAPFMWALPAMAARLILPGLENPDYSYAALCVKILPVGMMGIVLSGMFAATMSMTAAEYNVNSSVFTVDIYKRWLHKTASDRTTMLVARISTFVMCLIVIAIGLIIAYWGKGLFDIMVAVFGVMLPPIAIPVLWGILFPKPYAKSALSAVIIGLSTALIVKFYVIPQMKLTPDHAFVMSTLSGSIPTFLIMLIGVFIEQPSAESRVKVDEFFSKLRKPYEAKVISGTDKIPSPFPIVGLSSICIGILLVIATFFAKSNLHIVLDLGMGISLVLIGLALFVTSRRQLRKKAEAT